jgi:NAD(P)H-flavin reductase/hemoglobin-like flavoprotein
VAITLGKGFPGRAAGGELAARQHATDPGRSGLAAADPPDAAGSPAAATAMLQARPGGSARLLRDTFSRFTRNPDEATGHFYALLFARNPELRGLFPLGLEELRERLGGMLASLMQNLDYPGTLIRQMRTLGRVHRKYGVTENHYAPFLDCLLATIRQVNGPHWTAEAEAAWRDLLGLAQRAMTSAAADDSGSQPAWWTAEVIRHEQRCPDIAVLSVRPDPAFGYLPGQYLSVQVPRWPRVWRNYSIANTPRPDGTLDLHVRAVPGGMVSNALVHHTRPGDTVVLGPACGEMTLPPALQRVRSLVCVAGGTGLGPLKAIIESVVEAQTSTLISLFVGARQAGDLYDMADLGRLQASCPQLTVTPVVSHDPGFGGLRGILSAVVPRHADCAGSEVFICGPPPMVRACERVLASYTAAEHIHADPPDALR